MKLFLLIFCLVCISVTTSQRCTRNNETYTTIAKPQKTKTAERCTAKCDESPDCVSWTWNKKKKKCYLSKEFDLADSTPWISGYCGVLHLLSQPHNVVSKYAEPSEKLNITSYQNGWKIENGVEGTCCVTVPIGATIEFNCQIDMKATTRANFAESMEKFTEYFKDEYQEDYKKEANSWGAAGKAGFWGTWFGISASGHYSHTDETTNLYTLGEKGLEVTREAAMSELEQLSETTLTGTMKGKVTGLLRDPDPVCLAVKLSQIKIGNEKAIKTVQVYDNDQTMADPITGATNTAQTSDMTVNLL